MAAVFPVRGAEYIARNHLWQPLFNAYRWGGFLTLYLPEYPVAMDGCFDLFGNAHTILYFKLMDGVIPLESAFARAQTFVLEAPSPIAEALAALPGFRLVYQDEVTSILVRK